MSSNEIYDYQDACYAQIWWIESNMFSGKAVAHIYFDVKLRSLNMILIIITSYLFYIIKQMFLNTDRRFYFISKTFKVKVIDLTITTMFICNLILWKIIYWEINNKTI